MSEIKSSGLDQYGAEPFKQQQFRTASVEGVNVLLLLLVPLLLQLLVLLSPPMLFVKLAYFKSTSVQSSFPEGL